MIESAAQWPLVESLIDQALDQPVDERQRWLEALPPEHEPLKDTLRRLLRAHASAESADIFGQLPSLPSALPSGQQGPAAGDLVGPYRLLRELGQGGMGSVWLAERDDGQLKRPVALKLPHLSWAPGLAERMARERDILATLEHAHIARLYDAALDGHGRPWMALEYVQGRPIDEHAREKSLDVGQRVRLLLQVCEAVAYAHSRLVIHRDLKPANILVTDDGQVKLLDFGIAKLLQGDTAAATALTALAGRAMTRDYASPEQVRGEALTTASDVYSLGVVAYELLAGVRPYSLQRGSAAELEEAIETAEVPLASKAASGPALRKALHGDLDAILNLALTKAAFQRYPTVAALRQDFEQHLLGLPLQAQPDRWRPRLRRLAQRYRWWLGGAAAAGLTLLGGLYAQLAVMLALAAGVAAALWQRQQALVQRDLARAERARAAQSAEHAQAAAERARLAQERASAVAEFLTELLGQAQSDTPITTGELLLRAEKLAQVEGASPTQRAAVLHAIADMYSAYSNVGKAAELLAQAETLALSGQDMELLGQVRILQATVIAQGSNPSAGILALEQLAQQHAGQPLLAIKAMTGLAYLAQNNNDAAAAILWADRAQQVLLAMPRPAPRAQAQGLANLAYGKSLAGQTDEALALYAEAMQRYQQGHAAESAEAVSVLNNWGLAELVSGNPQRALQRFDSAMTVALRRSPDGELPLYLLGNRARVLLILHQVEEGLAAAAQVGRVAAHSGHADGELFALSLHADALRRGGDRAGARALIDGATKNFEGRVPAGGPALMGLVRLRSLLDLDDGRLEPALAGIEQIVVSYAAGGMAGGPMASALGGRADILLALGDGKRALADAQQSLLISRQAQGRQPHSAETGMALRRQGQAQAALGLATLAAAAWAEAEPHFIHTLGREHPQTQHLQQLLKNCTA